MGPKYVLILIVLILITCFGHIAENRLMVDEKPHYAQVSIYSGGRTYVNPDLTMIPGYHVLVASIAALLGFYNFEGIRAISFFFSICLIGLFYLFVRKNNHANTKLLQLTFVPATFIFMFLIYTDVMSMMFVLLAFYLATTKRYVSSGLTGILSMLIRQNNIIWVGFIFLYIFFLEYKTMRIKEFLNHNWSYLLAFSLFILFVMINKGLSRGDFDKYPLSFHLGNIFYLLFLFFFIFLPLNIANFKKILVLLRKSWVWIGITGIFIVYILLYTNNHPYNIQWGDLFIRNAILIFFSKNIFLKIIYFVPITYSILSLCTIRLQNRAQYLIYPFAIVYLGTLWLIDTRYLMIPLALFILFKKEASRSTERLTAIWMILLSLVSLFLISTGNYFL